MLAEIGTYLALFCFGVIYAITVAFINRAEAGEGFTAMLVVFGCGVTLAGCAWLESQVGRITTLQVFFAFAASGFPMTAGNILEYWRKRRNGRRLFRKINGQSDHDNSA